MTDNFEDIIRQAQKEQPQAFEFETVGTGALKHSTGKAKLELVPSEMIEAIGEVLTYGSHKYNDHNWRKGIPFETSYAAALRHMLAWHKGINTDYESGLHHLKHAMCNLGMIICQIDNEELDNRYNGEK